MKKWIAVIAVFMVAVAAYAQIAGSNYRAQGGLQWVIGGDLDVESGGEVNVASGGDIDIESGADIDVESGGDIALASGGSVEVASGGDITIASGGELNQAGETVLTLKASALTSPSVAFSVAGATHISLTADGNLTGVHPTGGEVGQVVVIVTGAGANTLRFDDSAASMTLGGNITLTEGQFDSLTLLCTSADGDEWTCIATHDN